MARARDVLEKILDAIELLLKWGVAWGLGLLLLGTAFLLIGLQLDATGARSASHIVIALMLVVYVVGTLLALADLALRVRAGGSIFLAMQRSWDQASQTSAARAMAPLAQTVTRLGAAMRSLSMSLLGLGVRLLGGLLLAVVIGFLLYGAFGLLSTAPWWAIVIIILLIAK